MNDIIEIYKVTDTQPQDEQLFYIYTSSLGLVQNTKTELKRKLPNLQIFETPDAAKINYYITTKMSLSKTHQKKRNQLNDTEQLLNNLDVDFGHLEYLYPEEFL